MCTVWLEFRQKIELGERMERPVRQKYDSIYMKHCTAFEYRIQCTVHRTVYTKPEKKQIKTDYDLLTLVRGHKR